MSTITPITIEQYEAFEGYPGLKDELILGKIVLSPQPKPLHQQVTQNVQDLLRSALRGLPYTVQQNSNVRFRAANSMPAPDVFVITKEQWNRACEIDDYLTDPPILVIETLSPANRRRTVDLKVELYLSNGVREVWLAHPKKQTLEVIRNGGRRLGLGRLELPSPLIGSVEVKAIFERER